MAKPYGKGPPGPPCTDLEDLQRRGLRLAAPPPKKVRFVFGERASAAVERPIRLKSAAEVTAEDVRRRKSLPSLAEDDHLDPIMAKGAYWSIVTLVSPFRTRGLPDG